MCDENLWKYIKNNLNNKYELIHINIPLKSSLDEMCDFLLKNLKDEKINLLGFSLGAYIASYFAVKYPKKISNLMLLGNSACDLPLFEIEKRKNIINHIKNFGLNTLARKKVQTLLAKKNQENDELILLIQNMYKDLGKEVFISQLNSTLIRRDLLKQMLLLKFPIMFVYSKKDILVNHIWMEDLKSKSKNILFYEFEGSSHMLPLEEPEEISLLIKKFF